MKFLKDLNEWIDVRYRNILIENISDDKYSQKTDIGIAIDSNNVEYITNFIELLQSGSGEALREVRKYLSSALDDEDFNYIISNTITPRKMSSVTKETMSDFYQKALIYVLAIYDKPSLLLGLKSKGKLISLDNSYWEKVLYADRCSKDCLSILKSI